MISHILSTRNQSSQFTVKFLMPLRYQLAHPNIIIIMNTTKKRVTEEVVMAIKSKVVTEEVVMAIKNKATEEVDMVIKNKVTEDMAGSKVDMEDMNNKVTVINKRATEADTKVHLRTLTPQSSHRMNITDIITKPNDAAQFVGFMLIALRAYILPNIDSRRSKLIHLTL